MAPETASTTDVWQIRAAHGAVAVRLVHVTPARKPQTRTRGRPPVAGRAEQTTGRRRDTIGPFQPRGTRVRLRVRARFAIQEYPLSSLGGHLTTA